MSLDVFDLLALTDDPNLAPDDAQFQTVNTLVITSDGGGDSLNVAIGAGGFQDTGLDTTVDGIGGYSVFDHATSNARLIIDDDIALPP